MKLAAALTGKQTRLKSSKSAWQTPCPKATLLNVMILPYGMQGNSWYGTEVRGVERTNMDLAIFASQNANDFSGDVAEDKA